MHTFAFHYAIAIVPPWEPRRDSVASGPPQASSPFELFCPYPFRLPKVHLAIHFAPVVASNTGPLVEMAEAKCKYYWAAQLEVRTLTYRAAWHVVYPIQEPVPDVHNLTAQGSVGIA